MPPESVVSPRSAAGHIKSRAPQGFPQAVTGSVVPQSPGGQSDAKNHHRHIKPELRVLRHDLKIAMNDVVVEREIDAAEKHENHDHGFEISVVKISDAGLMGGKPAGGHRGEGVADGIEIIHAAEPEQNDFQQGERHIGGP